MTITLPIYVRTVDAADGQAGAYEVRPLFFEAPTRRDPSLERALNLLATDLRKHLRELGRRDRHEELAEWAFCPEIESRRLDLVIELRRSRSRVRFLLAAFAALGRRLAFTPSVPGAWFEVARGERLEARAAEVLTEYFRTREREDEDGFVAPDALSIAGKAWVSSLTIDEVQTGRAPSKEEDARRAALGRRAVLEGQGELERVGRCLDRLYPDDRPAVVARAASAARRIEREFAPMRSEGVIDPSRIAGPHYRYFAVREQARRVLDLARSLAECLDAAPARPRRVPVLPFGNLLGSQHEARSRRPHGGGFPWRNVAREQAAADDIHAYVREATATAPNGPALDASLACLLGELALLHAIAEDARAGAADRVLLYVRPLNPTQAPRAAQHAMHASWAFGSGMQLESAVVREEAGGGRDVGLVLQGPPATSLARVEAGTHLIRPAHEPAVVLQVVAVPLADGADARATLTALAASRRDWQDRLEAGRAGWDDDPFPLGPVVRVYEEPGAGRDLRTGRPIPAPPLGDARRVLILDSLPLPDELAPGSW